MESSPPVAEAPRRKLNRRKLAAIVVAVAIPVAAFAAWEILRPRSIGEVLSMEPVRAGSDIFLQGTITAIGRESSSYGPRVYLQLDDNGFCSGADPWTLNLVADPNGSYAVEESYQTTLHMQSFTINGDPAVWTPQLACPFPALYRSIGVVFDAVSRVRNMILTYNGTAAGGWGGYEIRSLNATRYSPGVLPVDLLKALPSTSGARPIDSADGLKNAAARFYVQASAAVGSDAPGLWVADRMTSLAAPASANGTLRFVDADSDGLVGSGDRLDVRLPPTTSPNGWDTYILRLGNWSAGAPNIGAAIHVILVGPAGPLETLSTGSSLSLFHPRFAGRSDTGKPSVCCPSEGRRRDGPDEPRFPPTQSL
ncbi:MAG TPA: hypothetical protein VEO96_08295 [Thermoplasmata archaeon]|nr:hypothetical protein [Thermoplasmata archaeon]